MVFEGVVRVERKLVRSERETLQREESTCDDVEVRIMEVPVITLPHNPHSNFLNVLAQVTRQVCQMSRAMLYYSPTHVRDWRRVFQVLGVIRVRPGNNLLLTIWGSAYLGAFGGERAPCIGP